MDPLRNTYYYYLSQALGMNVEMVPGKVKDYNFNTLTR